MLLGPRDVTRLRGSPVGNNVGKLLLQISFIYQLLIAKSWRRVFVDAP
jgi:hypothetical protein